MDFTFQAMTIDYLRIIKDWRYEGAVIGIYTEPYFESHAAGDDPLRGPAGCRGYAVLSQDKLVGLFEYYFQDDAIEIGLALAPELTGKGLGRGFVLAGVEFGIKEFAYQGKYIKLGVDRENYPAIRVYEKAGFVRTGENGREINMRLYL